LGALPFAAGAQGPISLDAPKADEKQQTVAPLGGTPTIDIITLRALGPGAPLRFGNVIPNSERIQLDGLVLKPGVDYMMDNAVGVVYLKRAQKAGQTLTVTYRYDPKPAPVTGSQFSGGSPFKFSMLPGGGLNMLMGMGMTERAADGSVMSSNVFGFQNAFKFGQGSMKGLYVYGDRQRSQNQAGLTFAPGHKAGDASTEEGKSQLIVQNISGKVLGGDASVDYQDISKNFASFGAIRDSGLTDAQISRLQAERGLTRKGLSFNNLKFGGLGISSAYRTVGDETGGISWRSLGVQQGGLKVNWSSQKVDAGFNRFKDIGEADREQLMREAGMSRQNFSTEFANKVGKLSYSANTIEEDASGKKIQRREFGLDAGKFSLLVGEHEVAEGFNRFPSLLGNEQASYGREAGMKRQWMRLSAALMGPKNTPLAFSQSLLKGKDGEFRSQDASVGGKTWSLQYATRNVDQKFDRLNAMAEGEMDSHIRAIGAMYGNANVNAPAERGWFLKSAGIDRTYTALNAQPFKGWNLAMNSLKLKGQQAGGEVTQLSLGNQNLQVNYRRQNLSSKFTEMTSLMQFEQQRLGSISGLDRSDLGINMKLGGTKNFAFNRMTADTALGGAERTSVAYQDRRIDVQMNARKVDSGFNNVNQLVDAERDLLMSMRGFEQRDARLKWQLNSSLKLEGFLYDATNDQTDEVQRIRHLVLDWAPDGTSRVHFTKLEQKNSDPLSTLFANNVQRLSVEKNFGRLGRVKFLDEKIAFNGKHGSQPDSHRQYLAFETKLTDKTRLMSEQTRTRFENGDKEDVSANTISTELNKRVGVSVTDVNVDRKGDENDEKKRNYGFWFDLGRGLRLNYGYARHLQGEDAGTLNSTVSLGQNAVNAPDQTAAIQQGQLGNLLVGGAYGVNEWDKDSRTQAFSNINLSTHKPFGMGPFSNLKFNFGLDTAADYSKWVRERRLIGISGNIGSNSFAYEYKGQMHQSGYRGIDRTYQFKTDQSEKRLLRASLFYRVRTFPWDEQAIFRDFNIAARPWKNIEISHQLQTNPLQTQPDFFGPADALIGSIPRAARSNKWRVDYKTSPNFTVGGFWEELISEQTNHMVRTGGMNLKLFEKSGSPILLTYGLEQNSRPDLRRTLHRYSFQFDQRPGPNQVLSLFLGNVSYQHSIEDGFRRNNWSMRLDYQLRFWSK